MDYGERVTEKQINSVNKKLRATYKTAQKELEAKLAEFNRKFAEKDRRKQAQLAAGEITQQAYKDWLAGQVFMRGQWQTKLNEVCSVLHASNVQAAKIVQQGKLDVFSENYNYTAYVAERKTGVSFDIYNTSAVAKLVEEDPQTLPEWEIDEKKDYVWNKQKVNNSIMQGIIQGEGIDKITKRLCEDLATKNESKMRLFARTAMTGAQNAGRQQHMEEAAKMGITQKKRWVATLDKRTRDAHRYLDGQEVPYDQPFKSILGDIDFPGDPMADPANTFNCRCRIVTIYPKYEDYSKPDWREAEIIEGQTYAEWKQGKKKRGEIVGENNTRSVLLENLRKTAEKSADKVDFWMNLTEEQQAQFISSKLNLDEIYKMLGGGTNISEWKEPNPGGKESFNIVHDFSNATVSYNKVLPKGEGWMADANGIGEINIRKDGLGDDWDFIIAHELGHQLANYCPELQQMILYNPGNVLGRYNIKLIAFDGVYGEYNPEEAFATSVSVYIRHPNKLKEKYPDTYGAIDAFFNSSPSARKFIDRSISEYRKEFGK